MRRTFLFFLCALGLISSALLTDGQFRSPAPMTRLQAAPLQPQRKASDLIRKQESMRVNQDVLKQVTPNNARIVVSIPKQRAYLMLGDQIAIDAPISSGKRGHSSPTGHFTILEKDPNHHSSLYGDFVDRNGRVVRGGVSARIDSAPSGTHFAGAPMKWFLRLTGDGVGMHIGILPGYPASHGLHCARCRRENGMQKVLLSERSRDVQATDGPGGI